MIDTDHCPTCGGPLADYEARRDCDRIKPGTEADVLPVRCRREAGHPAGFHWHPPLWPATPDVVWPTP